MGLAAARALDARGHRVTLLERDRPGRAASWASAGIIGATLRREGDPSTQLRHLSQTLWPEFARSIQDESGMDPEYREMGCIHIAGEDAELRHPGGAAHGDVAHVRQLSDVDPSWR